MPAGTVPGAVPGRVLFVVLAVAVFVLDRVTKGLVSANIALGTEVQAFPGLWIANSRNSGAAFGMGRSFTILFLIASAVVVVGLIVYVVRNPVGLWAGCLLGLILGGAIGNGYDRLVHGEVTDFLAVHWWPVFNVADASISVAVVLLLAGYLLRHRSAGSE
jgi:signal peptidase II